MIRIRQHDDPHFANIETDNITLFEMLRCAYMIRNKSKVMVERIKPEAAKYIKDFNCVISENGKFAIGMLANLLESISNIAPAELDRIKVDKEVFAAFLPRLKGLTVCDDFEYPLRGYQSDGLKAALKHGRGLLLMGTGAGKSLTQASLIQSYWEQNKNCRILVVVPQKNLVTQLHNDFIEYGVKFTHSRWNGEYDYVPGSNVVICTHDILEGQHRDKKHKWIYDVNMVICDEAHTIKSTSIITKILGKIKTFNRFGFTGTLSKDLHEKWSSLGFFGNVIYRKSSKELRDEDFLTEATVMSVKLQHKKYFEEYLDETQYISTCAPRNEYIAGVASEMDGNVLILVNTLAHGEELLRIMKEKYPDKHSVFISGESTEREREGIKAYMEANKNAVCIAMASIFATGVNIKNLPFIILAQGGRAYIRLVQAIGRGLRLHADKSRLYIFDIFDNLKYSMSHYNCRKEIYEEEHIRLLEQPEIIL